MHMKRFFTILAFMLGCGSRTGLDLTNDQVGPGSGSGESGDETPFRSLANGPVDASVPGEFTGRCPPSLPYCVAVPGAAIFGCCATPQGEADGCLAPNP